MQDTAAGEVRDCYEAPELRSLGSIEEWTLGGGGNTIGISVILP
jgi:hypothetical protein